MQHASGQMDKYLITNLLKFKTRHDRDSDTLDISELWHLRDAREIG